MDLAGVLREHAAAAFAALALVGWLHAAARARRRVRALEGALASRERPEAPDREAPEAGAPRPGATAPDAASLERTLRALPGIAERLRSCPEVRQIPDLVLELLHEVFRPRYSIFFRVGQRELIAVAVRGATGFRTGQRIQAGDGVLALAAIRQRVVAPEDVGGETPRHRARALEADPFRDFQLCIPLAQGDHTLGVALIGPSERRLPCAREIARTLGSLTSATLHGARLLRPQEALARRDGLTGLLEPADIRARLDTCLGEDPPPRRVAVFLFDIDHFRHYNERNGQLAGDDLLKELGEMLRGLVREGEFVGRFGGEEFLAVLPGASRDEALRAAERIRCRVAGHPFAFCEHQPLGRVTISGGVASHPADGRDPERLLKQAEEALYEAKRLGRDRVRASAGTPLAGEPADADADESWPPVGLRPPDGEEPPVDADLGEPWPRRDPGPRRR